MECYLRLQQALVLILLQVVTKLVWLVLIGVLVLGSYARLQREQEHGWQSVPNYLEDPLFNSIIEETINSEGNTVDTRDKNGIGAYSKYGVQQRLYNVYRQRWGLKPQMIDRISKNEAKRIYYEEFYEGRGINKLNPAFQSEVFDWTINTGSKDAVKKLQNIFGVTEDGLIGANTIAASNQYASQPELASDINLNVLDAREQYYKGLDKKSQEANPGWFNRVASRRSKYTGALL